MIGGAAAPQHQWVSRPWMPRNTKSLHFRVTA